jgi:hypothetical protein
VLLLEGVDKLPRVSRVRCGGDPIKIYVLALAMSHRAERVIKSEPQSNSWFPGSFALFVSIGPHNMDPYSQSKSRWRPNSKSKKGKSRACRCSWCNPKRPAAKNVAVRDFEREYLETSEQHRSLRSLPAGAFIDWFFSPPDENEDTVQCEDSLSEGSEDSSLILAIGEEAYQSLLREHLEAEKQLKQQKTPPASALAQEMQGNGLVGDEDTGNEEAWDIVSEYSCHFDGWEEVILEDE